MVIDILQWLALVAISGYQFYFNAKIIVAVNSQYDHIKGIAEAGRTLDARNLTMKGRLDRYEVYLANISNQVKGLTAEIGLKPWIDKDAKVNIEDR